ncbi:thiamine phosphate synthase [Staphylococcus xylosus]|uniref:thiamine phosphate synthase n=1 Tax=Staphylococcus xylosus TaxID=1288 RepID=UPI00403EB116
MIILFIAITPYQDLSESYIKHYCEIEGVIDYLLIRAPMTTEEVIQWVHELIKNGFSKDKIIIHSDIDVIIQCNLSAIHFRENDPHIEEVQASYPDIQVSMSTHHKDGVSNAKYLGLDFVLFGHVFETPSKPQQTPRAKSEVEGALQFDIPIIAIGGINQHTLPSLPNGFSGIAGISIFNQYSKQKLMNMKEVWDGHV